MRTLFLAVFGSVMMTACSVFGNPGVEIAPYEVAKQDGKIEVRTYKEMVLVSAPMARVEEGDGERDGAFNKLFRYISGANTGTQEIAMTAPVFMDEASEEEPSGEKIAMTAPVFMDEGQQGKMSFVLPADMTFDDAPRPTDPDVTLEKVENLKVASITFSGFLSEENTQKHRRILERWMEENGYEEDGPYLTAGYNPPWTLPMSRRNEVLIPIKTKE